MSLLKLPSEVLIQVFGHLILCGGVVGAVHDKTVCKRFYKEIDQAIFHHISQKQPFPDITFRPKFKQGEELYAEFLFRRIENDHTEQNHFTKTLRDALDLISSLDHSALHDRAEAMRKACLSYYRNYPVQWRHKDVDQTPQICHSISENALALAARLGMDSVFQVLIEQGTAERITYFGTPLSCVAETGNKTAIQAYLSKRLICSEDTHQTSSSNETPLTTSARRGISIASYKKALELSMVFGTSETLYAIFDAAAEDDLMLHDWPSVSEYKAPDVGFNNHVLREAVALGKIDIAKTALERGAYIHDGWSGCGTMRLPLAIATENNRLEMVKFLLEQGTPPSHAHFLYKYLLGVAAIHGHMELATFYLDTGGMNFSLEDERDPILHPIFSAATGRKRVSSELIELFLRRGLSCTPGSKLDKLLDEGGFAEAQAVVARHRESTKQKADQE